MEMGSGRRDAEEGGAVCQQGGHPKAREGEGGAGGCGAAAGVDCPARLSALGSSPPGLKQPKIFWGCFPIIFCCCLFIEPLLTKPNFATMFNLF